MAISFPGCRSTEYRIRSALPEFKVISALTPKDLDSVAGMRLVVGKCHWRLEMRVGLLSCMKKL